MTVLLRIHLLGIMIKSLRKGLNSPLTHTSHVNLGNLLLNLFAFLFSHLKMKNNKTYLIGCHENYMI